MRLCVLSTWYSSTAFLCSFTSVLPLSRHVSCPVHHTAFRVLDRCGVVLRCVVPPCCGVLCRALSLPLPLHVALIIAACLSPPAVLSFTLNVIAVRCPVRRLCERCGGETTGRAVRKQMRHLLEPRGLVDRPIRCDASRETGRSLSTPRRSYSRKVMMALAPLDGGRYVSSSLHVISCDSRATQDNTLAGQPRRNLLSRNTA